MWASELLWEKWYRRILELRAQKDYLRVETIRNSYLCEYTRSGEIDNMRN